MDLEKEPSEIKETTTEDLSSDHRICERDDREKSCRESEKAYPMAIETVYCSQERDRQTENYFRSVSVEQLHTVSYVQDAHTERCQDAASSTSLYSITGPERRILACPHYTEQETVPGIRVQKDTVSIQSNAIRIEYSPENIHKANSPCIKGSVKQRNLHVDLPRRSPHHSSHKRPVRKGLSFCDSSSKRTRLDYKREEISHGASTDLPMAGGTLGSNKLQMFSASRDSIEVEPGTSSIEDSNSCLKETNYASPRSSELGVKHRQRFQVFDVSHQERTHENQTHPSGPEVHSPLECEGESSSLSEQGILPFESRSPQSLPRYNDRRFRGRMGNKNSPSPVRRNLRSISSPATHRSERIDHDFLGFASSKPRGVCDGAHRLTGISSCSKEGVFKLTSSRSTSLGSMASCSKKVNRPSSIFSTRQFQHSGRSAFKRPSNLYRMVSQQEGLSKDNSTVGLLSSDRSFCHRSEQQVRSVHVPLSRPPSCRNKCVQPQLGQVGLSVSVSTECFDFEGFSEASSNKFRQGTSCVPRTRWQGVVQQPPPVQPDIVQGDPVPTTSSQGQTSDTGPTNQPSRVRFIRDHYKQFFSDRASELMSIPIRHSSQREYQRKWEHFLGYLRQEGVHISQCTINHVVNFFVMLFDKKGLLASTVAHYRSALSVPLRTILKIDVLQPAVSHMIRAMALIRPSRPFTAPSWNLQKVLDYIEGLPNNITYEDCLARAAFLLLLSTGWRVSELHACVKMTSYCAISPDYVLKLRPHEAFLAKNELANKRWSHTTIRPLIINGTRSKLCPVSNLLKYLQISQPRNRGPLFTNKNNLPISLFTLSRYICRLILKGDPVTRVKVHDIRKLASSLSFMSNMDVKELLQAMNWRSSSAFFNHYLSIVERPVQPVAVPGGVIEGISDEEDEELLEDPPAAHSED